jgi:hypothetical protein
MFPYFLVWMALRSMYFLYLGSADPEYRLASEAGFGPALWIGEIVASFLAVGAAVGMWRRYRHTLTLTIAALGVFTSVMVFQLWQTEQDPGRARRVYATSRTARGRPVSEARLDQIFSPSGRAVTWVLGGVFCVVPLAVLLWRRQDFEPEEDSAP